MFDVAFPDEGRMRLRTQQAPGANPGLLVDPNDSGYVHVTPPGGLPGTTTFATHVLLPEQYS